MCSCQSRAIANAPHRAGQGRAATRASAALMLSCSFVGRNRVRAVCCTNSCLGAGLTAGAKLLFAAAVTAACGVAGVGISLPSLGGVVQVLCVAFHLAGVLWETIPFVLVVG
jgi:hypothetical protein